MDRSLSSIGRFAAVEWVERTGSTNADLHARVTGGDRTPAVLITDEQTSGRGRHDRRWTMKAGGGLLMSAFVPWDDIASIHLVPTALGLAASDAVDQLGCAVFLKWPNDLVSDEGLKVGGMLSEIVSTDVTMSGIVCGIGINVTWFPDSDTGGHESTSLQQLGAESLDRKALASDLIGRFDLALTDLDQAGAERLRDRYRSRCSTLGRRVRVEFADETVDCTAIDIDADGHLVVDADGVRRTVTAGDVIHLRRRPTR